jgi:hypothetical protein
MILNINREITLVIVFLSGISATALPTISSTSSASLYESMTFCRCSSLKKPYLLMLKDHDYSKI